MPTAKEVLIELVSKVDQLEKQVAELRAGEWNEVLDKWSEELDLPADLHAADEDLRAGRTEALDDLKDLNSEEREQVLAARRRLANDAGRGIELGPPRGEQPVAEETDAGTVVALPTTSAEQRALRVRFAMEVLQLQKAYDFDEIVTAYAEGGPLWLHAYDREFVVQQPDDVKRAMIADVEQTSPADAFDLGRDLLKVKGAGGPELTMEALLGGWAAERGYGEKL